MVNENHMSFSFEIVSGFDSFCLSIQLYTSVEIAIHTYQGKIPTLQYAHYN